MKKGIIVAGVVVVAAAAFILPRALKKQPAAEEEAMFLKIWPGPVVKGIMWFYRRAYAQYQSEQIQEK